jgi:cyclopropane fatty-acyl-phospholipid synthase-like methyltransferase
MQRTLEPELMDEDVQARAYAEADFAVPHDRFVTLLRDAWPRDRGPLRGAMLDLGCGPADVTVRVAKAFDDVTIDGVDGAEAMLALGRIRVAQAGLAQRVQLQRAFLPHDRAPRDAYDVVISNSLLHHLPEGSTLWNTVTAYAKPGAFVFVMDLMRPETPGDVDRILDEHAQGEPEILRRDFHASLHAAFTVDEVRIQLHAAGLDHLRIDVVSDRHFTVSGLMKE